MVDDDYTFTLTKTKGILHISPSLLYGKPHKKENMWAQIRR